MTYEAAKCNLEDHLYSCLNEFLSMYGEGLVPNHVNILGVRHVLDVACGSGGWVLDMAFTYPGKHIVGLDNDVRQVAYARARARVQNLRNATFVDSDMCRMPLLSNRYDLVRGRFLSSAVTPDVEQSLLSEMVRVCRPGGVVLLTEALYPSTNSVASCQWCDLFRQAIERSGSITDMSKNIAPLLYQAGCQDVKQTVTSIDFSYSTRACQTLRDKARELLEFTLPFLLYTKVVTLAQFELLRDEIMRDLASQRFEGMWPLVTFVGRK